MRSVLGYTLVFVSILCFVGSYALWYMIEESRECHIEQDDLVCTYLEDTYDLRLWIPIIGSIFLIAGIGLLASCRREGSAPDREDGEVLIKK